MNRIKKIILGILSAIICMAIYVPLSWVWFQFLPSGRMLDDAHLTFSLGVFCGIGIVVFAPASILCVWSAMKSIHGLFKTK